MYQLYYQPEGIWVGDIMPYGKEGQFYVYHQRDTRNPGPFGEPFGWALATTKDFVDYKDYGESLSVERMKKQISSSMQEVFLKQRQDFMHFIQDIIENS